MGLADDLGTYLAAQGVGTVGTSIFIGRLPETEIDALAIVPYGGEDAERTFAGPLLETPRVQVFGRSGLPYGIGIEAMVGLAYKALDGYKGTTIPDVQYIEATSPPFRIGEDTKFRTQVVVNLRVRRKHP